MYAFCAGVAASLLLLSSLIAPAFAEPKVDKALTPSAKAGVPLKKKTVQSIRRYADGSYTTFYTDGSRSYTTSNPKVIEKIDREIKQLGESFKKI